MKTPYPAFSQLGLDDEQGEPIQINDHILQIENEYYSLVRPKQVPQGNETPSEALAKRGVAYIELRAVDVNPYSPIGIETNSAGFLESLALYCLLQDSPEISVAEQELIEKNQAEVVERGRAENATIQTLTASYAIADWLQLHLDAMHPVATVLDQIESTTIYVDALTVMQQRIDDPKTTLSAQVIDDMLQAGGTWRLGSQLAEMHTQAYQQHRLSDDTQDYFQDLVGTSLQQQQQLEQTSQPTFKEYLANFR